MGETKGAREKKGEWAKQRAQGRIRWAQGRKKGRMGETKGARENKVGAREKKENGRNKGRKGEKMEKGTHARGLKRTPWKGENPRGGSNP
jgi:hypothetical protein